MRCTGWPSIPRCRRRVAPASPPPWIQSRGGPDDNAPFRQNFHRAFHSRPRSPTPLRAGAARRPSGHRHRLRNSLCGRRVRWDRRPVIPRVCLLAISFDLLPVQRSEPVKTHARVPSVREPQIRAVVAAVVHEFHVFSGGDQPVRDLKRPKIYAVARAFVIEGEGLPTVANLNHSSGKGGPAETRILSGRSTQVLSVGRLERI